MTLMMSELIHPTAILGSEVQLAPDVQVGPYAVLEGPMEIGPGCIVEGHACLTGPLTMGENNFVGYGAVIGKNPQSRAYKGEPTAVRIGSHNTIREYATIHRGTVEGGSTTLIGNHNFFMVGAHVGHDTRVGNGCTLVNYALLAGHVQIGDGCILAGHCAVQQRVRIGRLAMLGGMGGTTKDIPPFVLQQGYNCVTGLNLVGMRRAGFSTRAIDGVRTAFRILYKEGRRVEAALERIGADLGGIPEVAEFSQFIQSSQLGINPCRDSSRASWQL